TYVTSYPPNRISPVSGCPLLDCSSEGSSLISSGLDDLLFALCLPWQAVRPRSFSHGCGRGYGTGTGKLGPGGFNSFEPRKLAPRGAGRPIIPGAAGRPVLGAMVRTCNPGTVSPITMPSRAAEAMSSRLMTEPTFSDSVS